MSVRGWKRPPSAIWPEIYDHLCLGLNHYRHGQTMRIKLISSDGNRSSVINVQQMKSTQTNSRRVKYQKLPHNFDQWRWTLLTGQSERPRRTMSGEDRDRWGLTGICNIRDRVNLPWALEQYFCWTIISLLSRLLPAGTDGTGRPEEASRIECGPGQIEPPQINGMTVQRVWQGTSRLIDNWFRYRQSNLDPWKGEGPISSLCLLIWCR